MKTEPATAVAAVPATSTSNAPGKGRMIAWILGVIVVVLATTGAVYYTFQINDASAIHAEVATNTLRTRLIPQRLTKDLLLLEKAINQNAPTEERVTELNSARERLTGVLKALSMGGETKLPSGRMVALRPIRTELAQTTLDEIRETWYPVNDKLGAVTANPTLEGVAQAITQMTEITPKFDKVSETLNLEENAYSAETQGRMEVIRAILVSLVVAVIALTIPVFILSERLRGTNAELETTARSLELNNSALETASQELARAKSESDMIMQTVQQGLLLVDSNYIISDQYSSELQSILRTDHIAKANMLHLLRPILTEKMFNTAKDYFALLFDAKRKEKQILKVNPLDELEVNFPATDGGFVARHLSFSFRRIVEEGTVRRLFIGISDVTDRVNLELELRESEKKKDRQLAMLLEILHLSQQQVDDFVKLARTELANVSASLSAEDFAGGASRAGNLQAKLDSVFSSVHNIKGNAQFLQLKHFERISDEFESKLAQLKNRPALTGDDFLTVVISQSELMQDLDELIDLRGRLGNMHLSGPARMTETREETMTEGLEKLAEALSKKNNKEIRLDAESFDPNLFGSPVRPLVQDVLIQLMRNAAVHSVEDPAKRESLGKSRAATLKVRNVTHEATGGSGFLFSDDGAGLDFDRIRRKAIEQGLLTQEQADSLEPAEFAPLIFQPGFSTQEDVSADAGRGMGMDIIKQKIVDELGGEIFIRCEPGQFCEFQFVIPNGVAESVA